jgi:tetratricopeptide (TPR) repeat protein
VCGVASIDQLYSEWQASPTGANSLALCNALRGSSRHDLIDIVGSYTSRQHRTSVPALIAVGRMYMECGRYDDAQGVLLAAGKAAPRDASVYRWLGEILLHKGDAERAEKVFDRALGFGGGDDETTLLAERARYLKGIERAAGQSAAAHEFRKWLSQRGVPPPRPPTPSVSEMETQIRKDDEVRGALGAALGLSQVATNEPSLENLARAATGDPSFKPVTGANLDAPLSSRAAPQQSGGTAPAFAPSSARIPAAPPAPPIKPASRPPPAPPQTRPLAAPPPNPFAAAPNPFTGPPSIQVPEPARIPDAADVLEALAIAGIYEPDQTHIPAASWDRPGASPSRKGSTALLVVLLVLFIGGSVGAFFFVRDRRAKEHAQAEALLARADLAIKAGDPRGLPEAETNIGKAFDLESRSERAAMSWLRERAVVGLTKGGADVALEDATARAKEVHKNESEIAFAYVASFLFQGDTAGAISVMPKWDGPAATDPYYQLLAGATLERAGDARALERYAAATRSDPELLIAEVGLVRAMAWFGDPKKAAELAKNFRSRFPERQEGVALVALAWARDPARGDAPPEVEEATRLGELPISLRSVPHALLALRALDKRDPAMAKSEIERGLAVADSPSAATWLGAIAVELGDEALARRAALTALAYSAIFPPARVLAARVALLAGRLDEAVKATEDLDASAPDVVLVRAAVAYERLDADGLARALDSGSKEARKLRPLGGVVAAPDVLAGRPLPADRALALGSDDAPWADVVAMDSALDAGDLDTAAKIADKLRARPATPARKLRLSRLARYEGKIADADRLSDEALKGTVTARAVLERALVLVAAGRAGDVAALLKAYPQALGPLSKWVSAYALAKSGKVDEARGRTVSEDPAGPAAPVPARLVTAAALGAMRSTKAGEYIRALAQAGLVNPDVTAAAESANLPKLRRR